MDDINTARLPENICYQSDGTSPDPFQEVTCVATGRYVWIWTDSNQALSLGEVEVVGKTGTLVLNEWIHVLVTISSQLDDATKAFARIYANGEEIANGEVNSPQTINRAFNYIGRSPTSAGDYFDGKISDFMIYPRVLTGAEAQILFSGGSVSGATFTLGASSCANIDECLVSNSCDVSDALSLYRTALRDEAFEGNASA